MQWKEYMDTYKHLVPEPEEGYRYITKDEYDAIVMCGGNPETLVDHGYINIASGAVVLRNKNPYWKPHRNEVDSIQFNKGKSVKFRRIVPMPVGESTIGGGIRPPAEPYALRRVKVE